jgi:hypothetical protein
MEELDARTGEYNPSKRLYLARMYDVPQWMDKACETLLTGRLSNINPEDSRLIGLDTYKVVAETIISISNNRVNVAHTPPVATHCFACDECEFNGLPRKITGCSEAWERYWARYGGWIDHPMEALPAARIMANVEKVMVSGITGMQSGCAERTVKKVITTFQQELDLCDEATAKIISF